MPEDKTERSTQIMGLFSSDPVEKLRRQYAKAMQQARDIQRTGDIKSYALKVAESEKVAAQIRQFKNGCEQK